MRSEMMKTSTIILAAGKGTRMKSELPKVLIPIHGKPMVQWVIDALSRAGIENHCLIVGGELTPFKSLIDERPSSNFVTQPTCNWKQKL